MGCCPLKPGKSEAKALHPHQKLHFESLCVYVANIILQLHVSLACVLISPLCCSGMRWPVCSGPGCPSGNTVRTFGTTPPASPPPLPWTGSTGCSVTTATSALTSPGSRRCSFWKSSSKITWSRTWRVAGGRRTWRTTTFSTGEQDRKKKKLL